MISGKQKKFLRGLAHDKNPLVQIGQRGLTEAATRQIDDALSDHELIKVRIAAEAPIGRKEAAEEICSRLGCEVAGSIGHVLILYRAHPDNPVIALPTSTAATAGEEV
jgi:RNA-binding protein